MLVKGLESGLRNDAPDESIAMRQKVNFVHCIVITCGAAKFCRDYAPVKL